MKNLLKICSDLASRDENTRWQAAIQLGKDLESGHYVKNIWPLVIRWGSHKNKDIRAAIGCCILEHILQYHFDEYFPKCFEIITGGNLLFGDTFSYCGNFDQTKLPENQQKLKDLKNYVFNEDYLLNNPKELPPFKTTIRKTIMTDSLMSVKGFQAAGIACGVKASGKKDLGVIFCPAGAVAAGMFTTNKITSAAVQVCQKHAASRRAFGLVVNAGNANACTGSQGQKDALAMCKQAASRFGVDPHEILIASTGIIGHKLPMPKIRAGIDAAVDALAVSTKAGNDFAHAIMTTDTKCKQAARTVKLHGTPVNLAGTVKGAGMIGPNMATTIAVLLTDAAITKPLLLKALRAAVGDSFNKLTVDGHQSTNDTALLLASGAAVNQPIRRADAAYAAFESALVDLCRDLARQMALDAEGATRMFTVTVRGAARKADAARAARAVADYDLVKCAVHGADPNWGRIICAVGSCGVKLDPARLSCRIGGVYVFRNGQPAKFDRAKVSRIIAAREHDILIDLGVGSESDYCYGCDLSRGYVRINADYHT